MGIGYMTSIRIGEVSIAEIGESMDQLHGGLAELGLVVQVLGARFGHEWRALVLGGKVAHLVADSSMPGPKALRAA